MQTRITKALNQIASIMDEEDEEEGSMGEVADEEDIIVSSIYQR